MSFEVRCPQCQFISNQLGQRTPCLLHVAAAFDSKSPVPTQLTPSLSMEYDEPYAFGESRPTVDRPGPFTIRQYVRLQLLRTRLQAEPRPSTLDASSPRVEAHSLSSR